MRDPRLAGLLERLLNCFCDLLAGKPALDDPAPVERLQEQIIVVERLQGGTGVYAAVHQRIHRQVGLLQLVDARLAAIADALVENALDDSCTGLEAGGVIVDGLPVRFKACRVPVRGAGQRVDERCDVKLALGGDVVCRRLPYFSKFFGHGPPLPGFAHVI